MNGEPWQWINNLTGAVTTELSAVKGSKPPCFKCGRELGRQLSSPHFHTRNSIISFWTIRCPDCSQPHIIFNSTSVLPNLPETDHPTTATTPPDDTTQPRLLA